MKRRVRLTESELQQIITESVRQIISETDRYDQTMDKASRRFNQDTFLGRMRSKLFPGKAQQLQRIKNNAQDMGARATDTVNSELDKMGDESWHYDDYVSPSYQTYYQMKHPEDTETDLIDRQRRGDREFHRDFEAELGHMNKYGTGGRLKRPYGRTNSDLYRERKAYDKQQQGLS